MIRTFVPSEGEHARTPSTLPAHAVFFPRGIRASFRAALGEAVPKRPGFWKRQLPTKTLALAVKGDLSALKQLLDEHPEFISKRGPHGRTLLWEAARRGH